MPTPFQTNQRSPWAIGAFFVQSVVSSYERHYAALSDPELSGGDQALDAGGSGGKEASNLVVLLTELYNFQVVSCVLVYDIIRSLLDGDLKEFDVELLLKMTRSGFSTAITHLRRGILT